MKHYFLVQLLLFLSISQWLIGVPGNPFLSEDKTLKTTNPYLDIKREWSDTITLYSDYTPNYLQIELDIPAYKAELTLKEINSIIQLSVHQTPALTSAVKNEYLSNAWILLLIMAEGRSPENYPKTIQLLENSITDLNNVLIPIINKYNRQPPYTLFDKPPFIPEYKIPSYPSIQTAQNSLAYQILELLSDNTSHVTYTALNRRSIMYALNYPQDITQGTSAAHAFFAKLTQTEAFKRDLNLAKKEWQ